MKLIGYTARLIGRRPIAAALLGLAVLLYCIADRLNPVMPILLGLGNVTGGSIFENTISFLQLILDPGIILPLLLFVILFSVLSAAAAGAITSCFFHMVHNALEGKKRTPREFIEGFRKYFLRMSLISLRIIGIGVGTAAVLLVSSVPAMIVINSAKSSKPELFLAALFVSLLTAGIIFFSLMFFRSYMFFWFPAAFYEEGKAFSAAKKMVDEHFWNIASKYLAFDVIFVIFQLLVSSMKDSALLLIVKWCFGTIFLLLFSTYLFTTYKRFGVNNRESKA